MASTVIGSLKSLKTILSKGQRKRGIYLVVANSILSLLDVIGLAILIPVVLSAINPDYLTNSRLLSKIYRNLNFASPEEFLAVALAFVVIFFIVKNTVGIRLNFSMAKFSASVGNTLSWRQYNYTYNRNYSYFVNNSSSKLINRILYIPFYYTSGVLMPFITIIGELFVLTLILLAILIYNPTLFILLGSVLGPSFYFIQKFTKSKVHNLGSNVNRYRTESLAELSQGIQGYIDVKLKAKEGFFINNFIKKQKHHHMNASLVYIYRLFPQKANEIIAIVGIVIILVYSKMIGDSYLRLMEMLGLFAVATFRLIPSLNRILNSIVSIKNAEYTIAELLPLFNQEYKPYKKGTPIKFEKTIELRNISFRFGDSKAYLFENLNLLINKGETIGVSGESGIGKSTLMKILLRLHQQDEGNVLIDDEVITDDKVVALRNLIGYVKQDAFLIDGSIRENILFGVSKKDVDLDKLNQVVKQSCLKDLVDRLPNGLDTRVGEMGEKISGGQKQRIAIARALYGDAEILIFDEATNALDNKTERELKESIDMLKHEDKTVIIIAHRFSTLDICDRIYEVREGKIAGALRVEEGNRNNATN